MFERGQPPTTKPLFLPLLFFDFSLRILGKHTKKLIPPDGYPDEKNVKNLPNFPEFKKTLFSPSETLTRKPGKPQASKNKEKKKNHSCF